MTRIRAGDIIIDSCTTHTDGFILTRMVRFNRSSVGLLDGEQEADAIFVPAVMLYELAQTAVAREEK